MKTVKHHVSYNPAIVVEIPIYEHHRIHGNVPIKNELTLKMRRYDYLTKLSVMLKNWLSAYKSEFDQDEAGMELEKFSVNVGKTAKFPQQSPFSNSSTAKRNEPLKKEVKK